MILRLVIFDCDGVLVDTEPMVNALIAESLTAHGLPTTTDAAVRMFDGGTIHGLADRARHRGAKLPPDWVDAIYVQMFARLDQGVKVIAGVVELIDRIEAAGCAIAVASNGPTEKMRRSLGPSGLWDRFQGRIYSRQDHAPKPAPDMVLCAMAVAGVRADQTVMIDDSATGCRAARAARVRCLGYATEGQGAALAHEGAEVIGSMAQAAGNLGL